MKRIVGGVLVSAVSFLALQGCAHTAVEKGLDEKLAMEPAVENRRELQAEAKHLIESASGLNAEQRANLTILRDTTRVKMDQMFQDSLKLRSILIRDLVSPSYDEAEVDLIKDRMKDLENKKLSLLFQAVEKANQILGHQTEESKWVNHEFVEIYGGHHM